jgi:hypothetical protein
MFRFKCMACGAEIEATTKYTEADAQAYCSGSIKFTRNLLAREIGAAAYAERILKSRIKIDWIAVMAKLCDGDNSNGLSCSKFNAATIDMKRLAPKL